MSPVGICRAGHFVSGSTRRRRHPLPHLGNPRVPARLALLRLLRNRPVVLPRFQAKPAGGIGSTVPHLFDACHPAHKRQYLAARLVPINRIEGAQEIDCALNAQEDEQLRFFEASVAICAIEEG